MLTYNKIKWGSYALINTKKKVINIMSGVRSQVNL